MKKREKSGGRQKGSVNKVTSMTKEVISTLLADYQDSGLMETDWAMLEPKERITIAEKLMQYVMPKIQSVAVDVNNDKQKLTIEHQLINLSRADDEK